MLRDVTTYAGTFQSVYGLQGHLSFVPDEDIQIREPFPGVVFVKLGGMLIPYMVEEVLSEYRLKLDKINDPDAAAGLKGKEVYMHTDDVEKIESNIKGFEPEHLTGFGLYDGSLFVGNVLRVEIYPQQVMLFVENDGPEFMVPLAEDWINEIDENGKRLIMNLPEGLIPQS